MERVPIVTGKIDHHESGGWQSLVEPLARFHVTGSDQTACALMQPGVVADHEQYARRTAGIPDHAKNGVWTGIVEPIVMTHRRLRRKPGDEAFPGFACPPRRGDDRAVGNQPMLG